MIVGPYSDNARPPQGDHDKALGHNINNDIVGLCMMMPTDLFRKVGGFDTRFNTWEDDDFCARAKRHGANPQVIGNTFIRHDNHRTFSDLNMDVDSIMKKNMEKFNRKYPTIRVIAIAKNEGNTIKGFFEQFSDITTDFCLLDTGSNDSTIEEAQSCGARVESGVEFVDFAQARNHAIETFRNGADWIIMLDPDERLDKQTIKHMNEIVFSNRDFDIFLSPLVAINRDGSQQEFVPKPFLFRNDESIKWTFKVHEKLIGSYRQAIIKNAVIFHMIELHSNDRRLESGSLYDRLSKNESYFTDPEFRRKITEEWPILDYNKHSDYRIKEVYAGPLISVVIPTYDRPKLLSKAIESAIGQDYLCKETIVVGDSCPNLEELESEDHMLRVVNLNKNHGAGGAVPRNYAIMLAAGEYIAYLDDDNQWKSNHLSSVYEAIQTANAVYGFSSMEVDGKDLKFTEPKFQGIDTSCVVHHKDLIRRHGWWKDRIDGGYAHDWEFISRWADEKHICTKLPTLIYNADTSGQKEFLLSKTGVENG